MVWNCGFVDEAYSKVCFEEPREEGLSVFSKLTLLLLLCVHVLNDHFTGEKIGWRVLVGIIYASGQYSCGM